MSLTFESNHWALILGGSSGFGLATAQKLSRHGMNVAIIHRDRKGAMGAIEPKFEEIRKTGVGFLALNLDALSTEGRQTSLDALATAMKGTGKVRLLMHSIAFGNLKPVVAPKVTPDESATLLAQKLGIGRDVLAEAIRGTFSTGKADALAGLLDVPVSDSDAVLEEEDFARTVHSMGTSLVTWTQDLLTRKLFADDARVIGMTSEGNEIAWRGYAAVAAAKVALESVSRALAVELGPYGIRSNIVQAGVTDTPALRLIPGSDRMKADARSKNPLGRLTLPADVADFISLLCTDEARWVNGALLVCDGGERIAG